MTQDEKASKSGIWKKFKAKLAEFGSKKLQFSVCGNVAPVHFQDAQERYWILWRELEMTIHNTAGQAGLDSAFNSLTLDLKHKKIDRVVTGHLNKIDEKIAEHKEDDANEKESQMKAAEKLKQLMKYFKILAKDKRRLTKKENDLTILWRDMNFIRLRLLSENLIRIEKLPLHLNFCREEAKRLQLHENPEISELIHSAAMELDTTNKDEKKNIKTIGTLSTILSQLTEKRLQRMHLQIRNKRICQFALACLVPLSFILIYANKLVLYEQDISQPLININSPALKDIGALPVLEMPFAFGEFLLGSMTTVMMTNPLAFIFFGGLLGGFFSAAMRFHSPAALTGYGAFFKWYTLTKPFVGALGATILYVIISANIEGFEMQAINPVLEEIANCPYGAKGFSFAFLTGFSERIIMPNLHNKLNT